MLTVGGCGADVGGGAGIFDIPPYVEMAHWESISATNCRGLIRNGGTRTATSVVVYLKYSTPEGDTVLALPFADLAPQAEVAINAPPQVTNGELRFPHLENIHFSGQTQLGYAGESVPSPG